MGAREQFAGWGLYDNVAVCLTCAHQHLIPKAEQVSPKPWHDWLVKHPDPGHETFIVPHRLLGALGDKISSGDLIDGRLRHNADVKVAYAASAAYTITLTGLASDTNLLAGRESSSLSNTTNKYLDELISALITTGTSPTASRVAELHAIGALDDTPSWPDVFDGTDSAETITSADIKASITAQIGGVITDATSNRLYHMRPVGLRQFFGDGLPPAHVMFVTHSTAVALNATATNQFVKHTPVYATVT